MSIKYMVFYAKTFAYGLKIAYISNYPPMKKVILRLLTLLMVLVMSTGFTDFKQVQSNEHIFDIEDLYDYQKQFKTEEVELCASTTAKTYMDYRMTTVVSSRQYQFIRNELTIDEETGFLYDKDGFIAVALGSYFGEIGDRFYFTLESGIVLPLVKAEEKADKDTDDTGCYHLIDSSIIEFVIDGDCAREFFWHNDNGLILNGNYNNYSLFKGELSKVEKVLDEKNENVVTFLVEPMLPSEVDIFNYASGY